MYRSSRRLHYLASLVLLITLPGLAGAAPRVVVSIAPVHSLVQGVMHGIGPVDLLLNGNRSPHTADLAPSTIRRVQHADLVVWIGPMLEGGLARAIAQTGEGKVLTLTSARGIEPLLTRHHDHSASTATEPASHSHGESAANADPHLWLSSLFASRIVNAVTERLIELDPVNENRYRRNAQALFEQLELWRRETAHRLETVRDKPFMVFHDAFQYFETEFSLNSVESVILNPERKVGARRLSALRDQVRETGVVCLFTEPQFQPDAATVIVENTDARLGELDPVGAALEPGPLLWFQLMNGNVEAFLDCMRDGA